MIITHQLQSFYLAMGNVVAMSSALVAVVTAAVATIDDNCSWNKSRGNCDDTEKIAYVCGSYDDNGKTHTHKKNSPKTCEK